MQPYEYLLYTIFYIGSKWLAKEDSKDCIHDKPENSGLSNDVRHALYASGNTSNMHFKVSRV